MQVANAESDQVVEPKPIIQVDPNKPHGNWASYNAFWLGRIIVLLSISTQYCGIVLLWFRRARRPSQVRLWAIDNAKFQMVSSGLTAVIIRPVISILNTEWTTRGEPSDNGLQLPGRVEEGVESITKETIISSETSPVGRVVESVTAVNDAGRLRHNKICTCGEHLFTHIRSHLPHPVRLSKIKQFYFCYRALSLKAPNGSLCIIP